MIGAALVLLAGCPSVDSNSCLPCGRRILYPLVSSYRQVRAIYVQSAFELGCCSLARPKPLLSIRLGCVTGDKSKYDNVEVINSYNDMKTRGLISSCTAGLETTCSRFIIRWLIIISSVHRFVPRQNLVALALKTRLVLMLVIKKPIHRQCKFANAIDCRESCFANWQHYIHFKLLSHIKIIANARQQFPCFHFKLRDARKVYEAIERNRKLTNLIFQFLYQFSSPYYSLAK